MGDPLSISAGVAGLLALGLTATEGLNTLIANFRGAPGEIKELGQELRNLRDLLERASSLHQTHGSSINDQRFASTFDEHVRACVVPIQQLDETLRKLSCRSSVLLRPLWAVKKGQVRDLRTRLRDAKASLSLMIVLFNG
ncbi:MAG: hypothetical protein INR71_01230 [Terriglobus roseus]|nr:hypothetical protein [Terriglobus roseus]